MPIRLASRQRRHTSSRSPSVNTSWQTEATSATISSKDDVRSETEGRWDKQDKQDKKKAGQAGQEEGGTSHAATERNFPGCEDNPLYDGQTSKLPKLCGLCLCFCCKLS